jgi:hypothetical protein
MTEDDVVVPIRGCREGRFRERQFRPNRTEKVIIFEKCTMLPKEIMERKTK